MGACPICAPCLTESGGTGRRAKGKNVTLCAIFLFGGFGWAIPVECLPGRIITFFENVTKVPKMSHFSPIGRFLGVVPRPKMVYTVKR